MAPRAALARALAVALLAAQLVAVSGTCGLKLAASYPSVMTITNCQACRLATTAGAAALTLEQGFNYPTALGENQKRLWYTAAGLGKTDFGCGLDGYSGVTHWTKFFNSAYDGMRPEKAVISDTYIKIFVQNGGTYAVSDTDSSQKTTFYYALCKVSGTTVTCPTYQSLGEFAYTDNPFILINNIADGEYVLKVYSKVTTCTTCPSTLTDSSSPLQIPFIVMSTAPVVSITSTTSAYMSATTSTGTLTFKSSMKSRTSSKNTDSTTYPWPLFQTYFQVKTTWDSVGSWKSLSVDNDDGRGQYAYSLSSAAQGTHTFNVLTVAASNYSLPGTVCSSVACSSACPSMCLSDFTKIGTYNKYSTYSASAASFSFIYDSIAPPSPPVNCKSGECSGLLSTSTKHMTFEFTCSDANAPCTFHCALDGKPTLDGTKTSSLSKGYTTCTSPAVVKPAAAGTRTFTVYAVDRAGNAGELSIPVSFYVDNTAPLVYFAGVAKRCLIKERYFVPDLGSSAVGPTASSPSNNDGSQLTASSAGRCLDDGTYAFGSAGSITEPNTLISRATYGSLDCTCGTYQIKTSDSSGVYYTYNQATFPGPLTADSDSSLNSYADSDSSLNYLGYYPTAVPDVGLFQVTNKVVPTQTLTDGTTAITDSDGSFDITGQAAGYMMYDAGTESNTTDDISTTGGMYDTVIQVPLDVTREIYNLDSTYGAVLATKKVADSYYYHVLHATNSPVATVNLVCKHPEILNCVQSARNPFQMDCGGMYS